MNCPNKFNLETALQTNSVIERDVKEVIKKLVENTPKLKAGEKNGNNTNDRINTTNGD